MKDYHYHPRKSGPGRLGKRGKIERNSGSKLARAASNGTCTIQNVSQALMTYFYSLRYEKNKFDIKVM